MRMFSRFDQLHGPSVCGFCRRHSGLPTGTGGGTRAREPFKLSPACRQSSIPTIFTAKLARTSSVQLSPSI